MQANSEIGFTLAFNFLCVLLGLLYEGRHLSLSLRRKITVNIFIQRLQTFFLLLSRFFTLLTFFSLGTFFHLWCEIHGWNGRSAAVAAAETDVTGAACRRPGASDARMNARSAHARTLCDDGCACRRQACAGRSAPVCLIAAGTTSSTR